MALRKPSKTKNISPRPSQRAAPTDERITSATVALADCVAHERNYNRHPDSQVADIAESLQTFGQVKPVVVQLRGDGKYNIIAGHGVTLGARKLGWDKIEARIVPASWSKTKALAYLAADNELAKRGDPDQAQLAKIVADIAQAEGEAIAKLAAGDAKALRDLMAQANPIEETADAGELIDKAAELQKKWNVQRGDLWQCGKHRILCGDSTNADDVARVMQGEKAQYCFTSPPYGIDLDYEKGDSLQKLITLIAGIIKSIDSVIDSGYATMNYSDVFRKGDGGFTLMSGYYDEQFKKYSWWLRGNRVWFKPFGRLALSYATSTTMNLREWEYVRTWRKGNGAEKHREHGLTARGVWKTFGDDAIISDWKKFDDTTEKTTHQAAFPVVLPIVGIRAYTDAGNIVFEPFLGSGTTLVACEQTGRIGRGIEIEPRYVAVSLERLSLLGLECKRIESDNVKSNGKASTRRKK